MIFFLNPIFFSELGKIQNSEYSDFFQNFDFKLRIQTLISEFWLFNQNSDS